MPAQLLRQLSNNDVACPAGHLVGDCGIHCAVEAQVIDGRLEPTTVEAFCTSEYTGCTTWQAEKTRLEAGQPSFVVVAERDRRAAFEQKQVRAQRLAAARERIFSNTPEGRRLRRRLGLPEDVTSLDEIRRVAA